MLQMLRNQGFALNSSLAGLLLASLLLAALAPCVAMAGTAGSSASSNIDHASAMHHAMPMAHGSSMSHSMSQDAPACPHCDSSASGTSCMDGVQECGDQPAALLQLPHFELPAALPAVAIFPEPPAPRVIAEHPARAVPCNPSGRERHVLFCSFQE